MTQEIPATVEDRGADRRRYHLAAYSSLANIVSKALSLLVLYASVSLTIGYLGPERFGIWMTLASFISLLGFLDFGISSGLVSEVALTSARAPIESLRRLITHALLLLTGVGAVLTGLLLLVVTLSPLAEVFNVNRAIDPLELRSGAQTLAILIGLGLPVVGLQRIFLGLQRAFFYHLLAALGSVVSLVLLVFMSRAHAPIPALLLGTYGVQLAATLPLLAVLFVDRLVGTFDRAQFVEHTKGLVRHGALFFVLSIGTAIVWDADYIILTKILGAEAVAVYAVGVRLFQLVEQPLQMANAPLWSAYTDALVRGSHSFLRQTLVRAVVLSFAAAAVGSVLLLALSDTLVRLWIQKAVVLPASLLVVMALWAPVRAAGNAFAMYLNGVRVVRAQVIVVIILCVVALPLKILGVYLLGITGIVVATLTAYLICVPVPYLTVFRNAWARHLTLPSAQQT